MPSLNLYGAPCPVTFPRGCVSPVPESSLPQERQAEPAADAKVFLYSAPGRLRSQAHGEPADGLRALQDHVRQQKAEAWREGGERAWRGGAGSRGGWREGPGVWGS